MRLNEIARPQNQQGNDNSSKFDGVVEIWTQTANRPEEQCHGQISGHNDQHKGKDRPGSSNKTTLKIHDNAEDQNLRRCKCQIDDFLRYPERSWPVECEGPVLVDD